MVNDHDNSKGGHMPHIPTTTQSTTTPIPYHTIALPANERAELLRLLDDLDAIEAKIERHHRTALSGADTNPGGEIGGIRSRSPKRKAQLFDRFSREAKAAIKLYQQRDGLIGAINHVVAGDWMRQQLRDQAKRAERQRIKAEREAQRRVREERRAARASAQSTHHEAADLAAYNERALILYNRCEQERAYYGKSRTKDYNDLESQRAAGRQAAWIEVEATIAAAHLRGAGERATVATIAAALRTARARAVRYQIAQHEPDAVLKTSRDRILIAVDARTEAETSMIDHILAMLERGEITI